MINQPSNQPTTTVIPIYLPLKTFILQEEKYHRHMVHFTPFDKLYIKFYMIQKWFYSAHKAVSLQL